MDREMDREMARYLGNNSPLNRSGVNVYTRRRNRISATNGHSNPAPMLSMHRSVLEQIDTTWPPFSRGDHSNAVIYTRRRNRRTGDSARTSTSIPVPLPQQLEDSSVSLSGSEVDVENSLLSASYASSSENETAAEEEEQIRVQPTAQEVPIMTSSEGDGSSNTPLILTDARVLNCPICRDPLSSPLYQCAEGHVTCHSCSQKLQQMNAPCSLCRSRSGLYRCRVLERVLESTTASCCFRPQGCGARFTFDAKRAHEKECYYSLCSCPHCRYAGKFKELYAHYASCHPTFANQFVFGSSITISIERSERRVWLQERKEKILFTLCKSSGTPDNGFMVVCVAPGSSKRAFNYYLSADDGQGTVSLRSCADNNMEIEQEFVEVPYLHVPTCFATASGVYTFKLTIWSQLE